MAAARIGRIGMAVLLSGFLSASSRGQTPVIDADFARGDLQTLGWQVVGDWDIVRYPKTLTNSPGAVARFAANKPDGTLTRSFPEVRRAARLTLSLDYGWGWGDAGQGADMVAVMLLDGRGNGSQFEVHRTKAKWAVQRARVVGSKPEKEHVWAAEEIDATHKSVRDGGGLCHLDLERDAAGTWTVRGRDWNQGDGGAVTFADPTATSISQLVLLGTRNFDEQLFNRVVLSVQPAAPAQALPAAAFLESIGVVTSFPDRGQPLEKTVGMLKYGGFRWVRGGIEGLTEKGPFTVQTYLDLHRQA